MKPQSNQKWYRRTDRFVRGPLAAFLPFATLLMCQLITLQSLPEAWTWIVEHPFPSLLTYAVLLLAQMLLERLTASLFAGAIITMLPCLILSVASYLKWVANGVPLLISDLAMIGQAAEITGFLSPGTSLGSGTWLAILFALLLLTAAFFWTRPLHKLRIHWHAVTAVGLVVLLTFTLLLPAATTMLDSEAEGVNQATRNERLGILAGMYAAARQSAAAEPNEYTEDNMNRIALQLSAESPRISTPDVKPNVILIMSESFFDPTRLPNVEYSEDPVPNLHRLSEEYPSGSFYTNTYAGGTGNAEMEVFTGISPMLLTDTDALSNITAEGAYDRIPSIVKAFSNQGYQTTYVHSHTNALYSRTEHMPAIGFDEVIFREDFMVEQVYDGTYISDDCWADELIARFEAKEEDTPIFLYGLNMGNHHPFTADKFESESPITATTDLLDEDELTTFNVLIHGLNAADAALGKLVDYFSTVEEPTILVFYGDHLPRIIFSENDTIYDRLGYSTDANTLNWSPNELKYMLSTEYLVWNNYGADLDVGNGASTNSLGSQLLGWAGLPKPLYFYFMDTVKDSMLMYRDRLFIAADGTATHGIPKEYESIMERYQILVYDILYGEGYTTEALTGSKVRKSEQTSMPEIVTPPPLNLNDPNLF